MADEMFPVCSPALLAGKRPLLSPEDLKDHVLLHNTNNSDDWRLWLTAAGLPADISKLPGITFDLILMTVQAAIDGMGIAMGRTTYVKDDIAKGRWFPSTSRCRQTLASTSCRPRALRTRRNYAPSANG
jgi:LysR family glycine cleavage system transcriptional activator